MMRGDDSLDRTDAPSEEALTDAHRTVFDALDEAFCVIQLSGEGDGTDHRIVDVNRAFEDHFGLSSVHGKTLAEVFARGERRWIDGLSTVAQGQEPVRFAYEFSEPRRWYDVYAWPLGRPSLQRVAVHFRDVTEHKAAAHEVLNRSKQFHTLVTKAPIGVIVIDADVRIVEVNPAAQKMLGDVADMVGRDYEEFLSGVWPRELVADVVEIARRMIVTGVAHYDPELSVPRADGGITDYYDWRMERIRLPDGRDGVVCYFTDCSDQVRSRQASTNVEKRYRTIFKSIEEGFAILDVVFDAEERPVDYRFADVNAAFERHTGIEEPLGRTVTDVVPDIEQFWLDALGSVVRTGDATRLEAHMEALDRWFDFYAFLIEEGDDRRLAVLLNDVTEQKRTALALQDSVAMLRYHAHHDGLTGLPNRLQFEQKLSEVIATAERHGRPFAVLFLDIDGFKAINDDLGHASGDRVLIEIARRLRRSLRAGDFLARLHGDEFVVILPEVADRVEAGGLAEKLLRIVDAPMDFATMTVRVQASIGVGMFPNDGADARVLLRAADTAMYAAKQRGKNGVGYVVAPGDDVG